MHLCISKMKKLEFSYVPIEFRTPWEARVVDYNDGNDDGARRRKRRRILNLANVPK